MMNKTLVIQSHRTPLPFSWLQDCLDSVAAWAAAQGFDYRFLDDELFAPVPPDILAKTRNQPVIASDIARLHWLQRALEEGYQCAIWADADVLLFAPEHLQLPDARCAFGRENWIQPGASGRLRNYRKIHNAFMLFRHDSSLLPFYLETAERLVRANSGTMPPQFIGPKWLSALHNFTPQAVIESVDMLSPVVARSLLYAESDALALFLDKRDTPVAGCNLCASSCESGDIGDVEMRHLVDDLMCGAGYLASPG